MKYYGLVPRLERLFEPIFMHDSYSNRRGKGSHAAVARLRQFLRAPDCNYHQQLDIRNFFVTIRKPTLVTQRQHRLRRVLRQGKIARNEAVALRTLCHQLLR